MGISRLSQDLLPYAEAVVLGKPDTTTTTPSTTIDCLIIDGPSLVYFVYNKLLAHQDLHSLTPSPLPPSYAEINAAFLHLLNEFRAHGVTIQHIFFDGALPVSKRDVRLDRMEKLRQHLETYRKVYPDFPVVSKRQHTSDFDNVLWNTPATSTRKMTPLAPPFMVASVIESLRVTQWKNQVRVVPGEADTFCASAACRSESGVAILTNDSDLAVHDLGERNLVILLLSLEKKLNVSPKVSFISALSLRPVHVASRLKVPSLLRYGFERSLDSSASSALIQERAKDASRLDRFKAEYAEFSEEYLPSANLPSQRSLNAIDPRTAELIVDISRSPHVYLTPLLEDPSRDSSWSYGADIRQLAYSFLFSVESSSTGHSPTVREHARKGQRITSTVISSLAKPDVVGRCADLLELTDQCVTVASFDTDVVANWYILATDIVQQEKLRLDKVPPTWSHVSRLFGFPTASALKSSTTSITTSITKWTWDDTHLLGNMHAVLYSLRMLGQITQNLLENLPDTKSCLSPRTIPDSQIMDSLQALQKRLQTMPDIAELFLDIPALRRHIGSLELAARNTMIARLREMFDAESPTIGPGEKSVEAAETHAQVNEDEDWTPATGHPKKKRKREKQAVRSTTTSISRSTNSFSLLMNESE